MHKRPFYPFRGALYGILLGFLAGCAPYEPYADKTNNYQSIAIVSLLPDTIAMRHIGLTVFQNHFAVFPSEIDPNALAVAALTKHFSYLQIRDLGLNRAQIMLGIRQSFRFLQVDSDSNVQAELKSLVPAGAVDLILVVDGSDPRTPGLDDPGYGLIEDYDIRSPSDGDQIAVSATLELFDGHNFAEVSNTQREPIPAMGISSHYKWTGEPYDSFSSARKANMAALETEAVNAYIAAALGDLSLPINLP